MIYLFDKDMGLHKVVKSENVLTPIHEHELNGLILCNIELDLSYAKKFIDGAEYVGYYYKDVYYLHRIKRVEEIHEEEKLIIAGRHVFFDDMLAYNIIKDFRPQNRSAGYVLSQTVGNHTRWQIISMNATKHRSETFYYETPMEALNKVVEGWQIEYKPEILFDGQQINGFRLHIDERIGKDSHKRIPFGDRVLNLKHEMDYSEISTAVIGRGKGEEVGDGYGRRIEFTDSEFSRDGVVSPVGKNYMENPALTAEYGYDDGQPKFEVVVFDDIENVSDLLEATYEYYLNVSRPKMLFEASVSDLGDVDIGDSLAILRLEYDIAFSVRIHKLTVNLHYPEDAQVELGDYDHFKESKVERKRRNNDKQWKRETTSRIEQMKREFDADFNGVVQDIESTYEQAVIDAQAEVQAAEQRMVTKINTEITELDGEIESDILSARTYAEQQAQAHADAVQGNLDSIADAHQSLLDGLQNSVFDIDDFIGPKDKSLTQILQEQRTELEEKIEVYSRNYPNLVVGTMFEDLTGWRPWNNIQGQLELRTEESLNYVRVYPDGSDYPGIESLNDFRLENGKHYVIGVDFRSDVVVDLDNTYFLSGNGNVSVPAALTRGLTADGNWHRYYFPMDWTNNRTDEYRIMIGSHFNYGNTTSGNFDIRQIHVYEGDAADIPWTPAPSDNQQIVNQLLYEVRKLDDGMASLATKTEFDLLKQNYTTFTNEYIETSERVERTLQSHDDWLEANGARLEMTADGFEQKVWMSDITDINANLIPFSDAADIENMKTHWRRFGSNTSGDHAHAVDGDGFYVFRDTIAESNLAVQSEEFEEIVAGEEYTLSFLAKTHSNINENYNYTYIMNPNGSNHHLGLWTRRTHVSDNIYRYEWTFTAQWTGVASVMIGSVATSGTDANIRFKEPKLERGTVRTPYLNALSNLEQTARRIALQVQELDGTYLKHSEVEVLPDYVQIGSLRIDGDSVGSMLRVSPDGIDAVADAMRLSGDLYVDGDIETIAVDAIEGRFANLWAAEFDAITITGQHIDANTITGRNLRVDNLLVDKLIANTAFINDIKAVSIDAVHADLTSVTSQIMQANIIKSEWLNVDTALFDRITASEAFIDRLVVKAANVRDLEAVTIDAVQANLTTVMNSMGEAEGGLSIRRPDGAYYLQNGIPRGNIPVQIFDSYADSEVEFTGLNFVTQSSYWKTFKYFYTPHEGTRLRIVWAVDFIGTSTSEAIEVRVRNFSSYAPINMGTGTSSRIRTVRAADGTEYITQDVPMPPPNYNLMAAYLEFRRSPAGISSNNRAVVRILHIGQYD